MYNIKILFLLLLIFINCKSTSFDAIVMSDDMKNILEKYCDCVLKLYPTDYIYDNTNFSEFIAIFSEITYIAKTQKDYRNGERKKEESKF